MSRCVPDWDLSDPPPASAAGTPSFHLSSAAPGVVPMFEYEVAELTWENGQLAMHGLGFPRQTGKILGGAGGDGGSKYTWDNKPVRASGTLESLVNQGTGKGKMIGFDVTTGDNGGGKDLVPWLSDHHRPTPQSSTASAAMTMDAMVPSNGDTAAEGWAGEAAAAESSDNHVAARVDDERGRTLHERRGREAARVVHATREWSSCRNKISVNGSAATIGREIGQKATLNTRERDFATATTATSQGSLDDTNSGKPSTKTTTTDEDRDSVCHSTHQVEAEDGGDREKESPKSSISTKRSRAAATHNLSERKRRDRINDRMKTLQKLVPNSSKTDKASMLDEVIEYLKQMQAQVNMMSRINMPMMLPVAMQQQQQLPLASMMAPVGLASMGMSGMGMGVGLGMDHWNMIANRSGLAPGMSPLGFHPTAFMPVVTWDGSTCNQLQPSPTTMMADPLSTFHAYQSQPMTMEAYNRIALMFQQLHQHPPTTNGPNRISRVTLICRRPFLRCLHCLAERRGGYPPRV